ncbi:uncharacterized protein [Nicotiana sylvestris]|uniref:uncharacterized protein n=1 Tax=Nicotiana sylvestris TaxID=4096 RepID=UPI00388C41C4
MALKRFYMDKAHTLSTPMVVRSLEVDKDLFDIAFSVNLLARYSSSPTRIKDLFLPPEENDEILVPDIPKSLHYTLFPLLEFFPTGFFLLAVAAYKQLTQQLHFIREKYGLGCDKRSSIFYKGNAACIAQLKRRFIKGDRTKHISPKLFYTHDLQKNGDIDMQQIRSTDNPTDLFTKSLPTSTCEKMDNLPEEDYPFSTPLKFIYKQLMQAGRLQAAHADS